MSVTNNLPNQADVDDKLIELHLTDIVAFVRQNYRRILVYMVISGVLGGLYAFSKPNEYTSQVTLLPEIQVKGGSSLGNIGSLAGLAGIDVSGLNNLSDVVRPELYPTVLQSAPFALALSKQPVFSKKFRRTESLESFVKETNQPGWFGRLFIGKADSIVTEKLPRIEALQLTKQQDELAKYIIGRVTGTYDKKSGVLMISSMMQDPMVAAATTNNALAYLTDYVTGYRTEKARQEVDFLNKQVAAAKRRYQEAEYALSAYRDQNRSVYLNTAKIEEQRIQAEFLLSQELYNTLSKQSEMAKIKVQQDTPVFKVLEPAQVPLLKSGPKRTITVLLALVAGLVVGAAIQLLRHFRSRLTY